MAQTYTVRIKNGTKSVKRCRIFLWWKKYTCIRRENSRVYYEKKECSRWEKNHMQRYCRRRNLTFEAVPTQYTRSSNYRSLFFAKYPSPTGKYRCAYCGKKKPKDKITIDHIFPVHCMEEYPAVRRRAALFGIHGSNDMKNLCTACMRCNQKKEAKMGIWILKGFIGKQPWYWPLRRILTVILVFFCAISRAKNIYACGMELDKYITKIKAGKMYKYMQTRELFSRGEKHEKQDVTYGG